jgi:hypothetical protein
MRPIRALTQPQRPELNSTVEPSPWPPAVPLLPLPRFPRQPFITVTTSRLTLLQPVSLSSKCIRAPFVRPEDGDITVVSRRFALSPRLCQSSVSSVSSFEPHRHYVTCDGNTFNDHRLQRYQHSNFYLRPRPLPSFSQSYRYNLLTYISLPLARV